jgi:hypothetical protein
MAIQELQDAGCRFKSSNPSLTNRCENKMQEKHIWIAFTREIGELLSAHRVENRLEPGFPDVLWTGLGKTGVFELKDWEGSDWVSREQALWLRFWAERGGIGGVLAKKTRGDWLWYPANPSFEWMRAIQHKNGIAPALSMSRLTASFILSLIPGNEIRMGNGTIRDPRLFPRNDVISGSAGVINSSDPVS